MPQTWQPCCGVLLSRPGFTGAVKGQGMESECRGGGEGGSNSITATAVILKNLHPCRLSQLLFLNSEQKFTSSCETGGWSRTCFYPYHLGIFWYPVLKRLWSVIKIITWWLGKCSCGNKIFASSSMTTFRVAHKSRTSYSLCDHFWTSENGIIVKLLVDYNINTGVSSLMLICRFCHFRIHSFQQMHHSWFTRKVYFCW